jgi:inward rectifier potassium channel
VSEPPDGAPAADEARPALVEPGEPVPPSVEELRDLGFGTRVSQQSRQRLLNRDGSFNVYRRGLSFFGRLDAFHALLTMSWKHFFALSFAFYVLVNAIFGVAFALCGPEALAGVPQQGWPERLPGAFFFSVETFTTVGYGNIAPRSMAADLLVTFEAFIGLLATALVTGIAFARFTRPTASIAFSNRAVIAPYRGGQALMFRMINLRRSELSSLEATVVLALVEERRGVRARRFHSLALERSQVAFFPLAWTVVHPIDNDSPLWDLETEALVAREAELLVLITARDDKLSQTTQARTSYAAEEIVCGARFADMFEPSEGGPLAVNVDKLDEIEPVELPLGGARTALPASPR